MTVIQLNTTNAPSVTAELPDVLRIAKEEAQADGLPYAGIVTADEAWKLFIGGRAE